MSNENELEKVIRNVFPRVLKRQGYTEDANLFTFRFIQEADRSRGFRVGLWYKGDTGVAFDIQIPEDFSQEELQSQIETKIEQAMRDAGHWREI